MVKFIESTVEPATQTAQNETEMTSFTNSPLKEEALQQSKEGYHAYLNAHIR